jgi:hypothetical protein
MLSLQLQNQMIVEWWILKVILENGYVADADRIIASLSDFCFDKKSILEGIARLDKEGTIQLTQYDDYILPNNGYNKPLIRALKKKKPPTINLSLYEVYGWRIY